VSVHRCSFAASGVVLSHPAGGRALQPSHQFADRQGRWVADEQVHVIGFAVELDQLGPTSAARSSQTCRSTASRVARKW